MSATRTMDRQLADSLASGTYRPQPLVRETFEVYAIVSGTLSGSGNAHLMDKADSLDAALARAPIAHKATFAIKRTNILTGEVLLHFYQVRRKSRPAYRYHDYQARAVHDCYAEHMFDLNPATVA